MVRPRESNPGPPAPQASALLTELILPRLNPAGLVIKVSATLKIAIFPYLRFQRFQIDMLESFL